MAQHDTTDTQSHRPAEEPQEMAGYTALPNLLLQELGGQNGSTFSVVLFIARHTIGRQIKIGSSFYRVKTVCLSYDEFRHGRRKRDGTRMQPPSGLSDDKAVMRGCQSALAHGLIEIGEDTGTRGVRLYSIPARFWRSAGFSTAIQMLADPRVPSSFEAYRLIPFDKGQELTAGKIPADRGDSDLMHTFTAGTTPALESSHPLKTDAVPGFTAVKSAAVVGQNASSTAGKMPADPSDQPAQEAARGERKHSNKHRKLNIDRTYDTTEVQNEMQKESENTKAIFSKAPITTQPDLPASSAASPDRQAPGEGAGVCLHPPPDHAPPTAGEEAAEMVARRQRLLAIQRELAHLKRTPSIQLLARQRIPRLEVEIKQLVSALQANA